MDILSIGSRSLTAAATSDAHLYTMAVNKAIPLGGGGASDAIILYASCLPTSLINFGTKIGGTSNPVKSVQPAYFPVATAGAECAALVGSLDWADSNLMTGYEFVQVNNSATPLYFVSGVLNSGETDYNNPFETGGDFKKGACWAGDYAIGINPF